MDCSLPGSSVQGFSRQEYWSGLQFPSPGYLPGPLQSYDCSMVGIFPSWVSSRLASSLLAVVAITDNCDIFVAFASGFFITDLPEKPKRLYIGPILDRINLWPGGSNAETPLLSQFLTPFRGSGGPRTVDESTTLIRHQIRHVWGCCAWPPSAFQQSQHVQVVGKEPLG